MKRKLISAALCATMVGSLLAGSAMTAFADEAAADNGDIKDQVSIWSSPDVLGCQCKKIHDEAAKALGVEVQYVDQGHVSEQVTFRRSAHRSRTKVSSSATPLVPQR